MPNVQSATWMIYTLDSTGYVGFFSSIALDSSDHPHISYKDETNDDLKYARWTGTTWTVETIDSVGNVGWWPSIALDSSDRPHISYYIDTGLGNLKYAQWTGMMIVLAVSLLVVFTVVLVGSVWLLIRIIQKTGQRQ